MDTNNGHLDIIFRKKASGQTYLAKQFYKVPLQVMPPYYQDDDGTAFLYLLNPSGGILQHDRLVSKITVEKDAKAFITTPGNTKFYKMDEGHAEIDNYFTVDAGGVLEYLPEHNVPFADSKIYQNAEYRLDKDATLIASDLVTAGRVSRGEIFDYDHYSSKTKIFVDDKIVAYDNTVMEPQNHKISEIGILEGFQSNGSMYVYKKDIPSSLIDDVRAVSANKDEVRFGASMVNDSLMIIRFVGNNILSIQDTLNQMWSVIRKTLLNKNSVRIRKY